MLRLLLQWVLSAIALIIVSYAVPGITVFGFKAALIAALVIGFLNATIGLILKIITFPLTVFTLGIFWFVINGLMIYAAGQLVTGFHVASFGSAFIGAILLAIVHMLLRALLPERTSD